MASISDVAEVNPKAAGALCYQDEVAFVAMADLDSMTAIARDRERRPYGEVVKGYTAFQAGDLLLAKITPCFENGKIGQAQTSTTVAFGSTEFHVVRPQPDRVESRYLLHFLRQPWVLELGELRMTGSGGQRRVPQRFFDELEIPLPPIEEQRRIAHVLDAAEALRSKRRLVVAKLNTLIQAVFVDMFGSLDPGEARWPSVPFGSLVADRQLGIVRSAQDLSDDERWPYLRMNSIGPDGELSLHSLRRTSASPSEAERYRLSPGDLVFNTRNARDLVGKSAIFRGSEPVLFNNNILRLRFVDDVDPEWVNAALRMPPIRWQLHTRKSGTTSVFAIYFKDLATVPIPLPPTGLQHRFASLVSSVRSRMAQQDRLADRTDALLSSLRQRAFRGEL
ncbi:MAG: restriction endonuclease subunit S [Acidimicrobiales bacterium]|nr:restriction endonuclease subunit S [Acidimicrobiales bacterium]